MNYRVKSSAGREDMPELEAHVLGASPVLDIVRNPVPLKVKRIN